MQPGFVRIIAGKWRGRRLRVLDMATLRPTPDRVRETLFNWLAPYLPHAHCLDLFAGSGALGFEALSRGAAHVVMVDQSQQAVTELNAVAKTLDATGVHIYCANVPTELQAAKTPFNVVFLDPPYQADLLFSTCEFLEKHGYLANVAYIYLEADTLIEDNKLPATWSIIKQQKAGQVYFHLAKRELSTV